jgi:branched-chain amino acid transport system substrate-binding protein
MRRLWLPLLFCLTFPAGAAGQPLVRLGVVVPMAKESGSAGQSMRRAAELAVETWTPRLGRPIEIRFKEDLFDPRHAAVAAEELVGDGVSGVVGHFFSSSSIAAAPVYRAAGVPQVTAASTHPRLTALGFDSVFRVCGRDDRQGPVAADFLLTRLKANRVGVVHDRTEYGRGLAESLRQELARRGARAAAEESLAQGDTEFGAQVSRLTSARPDAVYFGGTFREAGHLLRQLRQAGFRGPFVGGDAVLDPGFVALAGEEATDGAYVTFTPDPHRSASAQPLVRRYVARYGSLGPYVLQVYDGLGVLLNAIQSARPGDAGKEELRNVVLAIRARAYDGALGTLRWDRNGDLTVAPYAIYVARRGGAIRGWFEQVAGDAPPPIGARRSVR